jgi:hypothetical protein
MRVQFVQFAKLAKFETRELKISVNTPHCPCIATSELLYLRQNIAMEFRQIRRDTDKLEQSINKLKSKSFILTKENKRSVNSRKNPK